MTVPRSNRTKKGLHIIPSLLGVNGNSRQNQPARGHQLADNICLILVCVGFGYLAALQGYDSIPLNADALAPFEEAKNLISNQHTHLFNIHVSRIASIFPDLTILAFIQRILPKAGFLEVFSVYTWCTSFLFLLLATLLTNEIKPNKEPLTAGSIKISLITVSLLNISHEFNIAYSHFITPVHHGGNVLNTLLLLTLAIKILRRPKEIGTTAAFLTITVLAVMSNKLSIFTAIVPTITLFAVHLKGQARKFRLIGLSIAILIGVVIDSFFNKQCASPEFNIWGTINALQQYFQLSWITAGSGILAIASLGYIWKDKSTKSALPLQTCAGLAAISLSSLSYFIYLPMLTSSGEAPLRYISIAYALIVVFFAFYIHRTNTKLNTTISILLVTATIISFQAESSPELYLSNHHSLKQSLIDRSERIEPAWNDAAKFIETMGYTSYLGLGDYWMTGATLASNSKLQLIPIHNTGIPDFWGATPQDIKRRIKPLSRDNAYLVSNNENFNKKFQRKYGLPMMAWKYDSEERIFKPEGTNTDRKTKMLIFNNPLLHASIKKNSSNLWDYDKRIKHAHQKESDKSLRILIYNNQDIYTTIRRKSHKFRRQCKNIPKYAVR